jgi:DNA-binding MarR family transcriptional regulator
MQLPTSPDLTAPSDAQKVLDQIRRVVQRLRESSIEAERRVGLTGAQLFVLQSLEARGPMTVNALAAHTATHQSSVSVVTRTLEEAGLVQRRKPPAGDGRFVELSVTARGRATVKRAPPMAQERMLRAVRRMRPAERATLARWLARLAEAMEASAKLPPMLFEDEKPRRGGRRTRARKSTR